YARARRRDGRLGRPARRRARCGRRRRPRLTGANHRPGGDLAPARQRCHRRPGTRRGPCRRPCHRPRRGKDRAVGPPLPHTSGDIHTGLPGGRAPGRQPDTARITHRRPRTGDDEPAGSGGHGGRGGGRPAGKRAAGRPRALARPL
ncbi:MAG: hypothetical protein AVDCRST_MAG54-1159, partial [uncultured Actinomycetospora sp.]